jgi:predicted transcriptional regulator
MKHLSQLIELDLISEEVENGDKVFKLTIKGRKFILEFAKVEKFAEAFGINI